MPEVNFSDDTQVQQLVKEKRDAVLSLLAGLPFFLASYILQCADETLREQKDEMASQLCYAPEGA